MTEQVGKSKKDYDRKDRSWKRDIKKELYKDERMDM